MNIQSTCSLLEEKYGKKWKYIKYIDRFVCNDGNRYVQRFLNSPECTESFIMNLYYKDNSKLTEVVYL